MRSQPDMPRLAAALLAAAALGACSSMSEPGSPSAAMAALPAAIQAPAGERVAFTWQATGTQIYECRAAGQGGWAWQFVAPEADLFGAGGQKVGTHGAGPHWTALDGSRTVGTVKGRADAKRPADIPWLLLSAKSAGIAGRMDSVTSVQRINTVGGIAPAQGCATQADQGKRAMERYSADYVFLVAR
ncbi:DUF3455 domain-containing protein [Variovorax sp. JS1663]|uniref:DUF3455 domain-containing protein n=1 Tax=Variovorax sp. JS1663 TaxID=1851577 RepID=UPI000B347989|nr:DUF3455 domain-containing protein [Variovorax sp. JS1663]OUL99040.1 hypothetical protein A8M77_28360 [Variovorax sp. JS1663]